MKRLSLLSLLLPALFAPGLFVSHAAEGGGGGGSKIEAELRDVCDLSNKRGESRDELIVRVMRATGELTDAEWEKLSQAAQDWFNTNADAKNANPDATMLDFPDLPQAEQPATTTRRRSSAAPADAGPETASADNLAVGQRVRLTTKRGKVHEGEVVELTKDQVAVKGPDGIDDIDLDRLDKVEIFHGTAKPESKDEPADPMAVGNTVKLVTKRGKEVTGPIVEVTDEIIVLKVDGKDDEYNRERVESITLVGGAAAPASPPAASSRRSSGAAAGTEPAAADAKTRSSNPPGVSVGQRIREIMAGDPDIKQEAVGAILTKEKLEFKEASLKMNYGDNVKFLDCLRAAKRLK